MQVIPLTATLRNLHAEIVIDPDMHNGLTAPSAAQCQHIRAVAVVRLGGRIGNVGPHVLAQLRETLADLLDL